MLVSVLECKLKTILVFIAVLQPTNFAQWHYEFDKCVKWISILQGVSIVWSWSDFNSIMSSVQRSSFFADYGFQFTTVANLICNLIIQIVSIVQILSYYWLIAAIWPLRITLLCVHDDCPVFKTVALTISHFSAWVISRLLYEQEPMIDRRWLVLYLFFLQKCNISASIFQIVSFARFLGFYYDHCLAVIFADCFHAFAFETSIVSKRQFITPTLQMVLFCTIFPRGSCPWSGWVFAHSYFDVFVCAISQSQRFSGYESVKNCRGLQDLCPLWLIVMLTPFNMGIHCAISTIKIVRNPEILVVCFPCQSNSSTSLYLS